MSQYREPDLAACAGICQGKADAGCEVGSRQHLRKQVGLLPQTACITAGEIQPVSFGGTQPGFGMRIGLPLPLQSGDTAGEPVAYLQAPHRFAAGGGPKGATSPFGTRLCEAKTWST